MSREAATYVKLRRMGYSINILALFFGRSTSMIHRILKNNGLTRLDMRKLPNRIKRLALERQWKTMQKFLSGWESWMLGQGEKPP